MSGCVPAPASAQQGEWNPLTGEDGTHRCPFKNADSGQTSPSHLVCFRHPRHNAAPSLSICCARPCNFFYTSSLEAIPNNSGPSSFPSIIFPTCQESRSKWIVTGMPTTGTVGRHASNTQHTTAVLVRLSPPCTVDRRCVANKSSTQPTVLPSLTTGVAQARTCAPPTLSPALLDPHIMARLDPAQSPDGSMSYRGTTPCLLL